MKTFGKVLRYALLTGDNRRTSPYETIEQLLIVLLVLVLPLPPLEDQPCSTLLLFLCETGLKPALMCELDAQQKLKMNTILTYRLEILCWQKQPTDHSQCWKLKEMIGRWLIILPTLRCLTKTMQIQYQLTPTQVQTQYQLTSTRVQTQYRWTPTQVEVLKLISHWGGPRVCPNFAGDRFKKCGYGHCLLNSCYTLLIKNVQEHLGFNLIGVQRTLH